MRITPSTPKIKTDNTSVKLLSITTNYNLDKVANPYVSIVKASLALAQKVWESEDFQDALFSEIFLSNDLEGELSKWRHEAPKEIWKQLFSVTNVVGQGLRGKVDLELATYNNSFTSAIGYGKEGESTIYLNIKFLKHLDLGDYESLMNLGSLITHEFSHKVGFSHEFRSTKKRDNSLPYVINRAFNTAFKKVYAIESLKQIPKTPWYKKLYHKLFK